MFLTRLQWNYKFIKFLNILGSGDESGRLKLQKYACNLSLCTDWDNIR